MLGNIIGITVLSVICGCITLMAMIFLEIGPFKLQPTEVLAPARVPLTPLHLFAHGGPHDYDCERGAPDDSCGCRARRAGLC